MKGYFVLAYENILYKLQEVSLAEFIVANQCKFFNPMTVSLSFAPCGPVAVVL